MKKNAMLKRNATIAAMASQGVTATRLAVDFGLSEGRIYQLIRAAGPTVSVQETRKTSAPKSSNGNMLPLSPIGTALGRWVKATGNGEGTIRSEYFWKKRNKYIAKGLDRNKAYHKAALKTLDWCLKDESRMADHN